MIDADIPAAIQVARILREHRIRVARYSDLWWGPLFGATGAGATMVGHTLLVRRAWRKWSPRAQLLLLAHEVGGHYRQQNWLPGPLRYLSLALFGVAYYLIRIPGFAPGCWLLEATAHAREERADRILGGGRHTEDAAEEFAVVMAGRVYGWAMIWRAPSRRLMRWLLQ